MLLISHDLAAVSKVADTIAVMQAGRIVERRTREQIFNDPQHPYTRALLAAVPAGKPRFVKLSPTEEASSPRQTLGHEQKVAAAEDAQGERGAVVRPVLSARKLSKSFAKGKHATFMAVKDVSFELLPGRAA
ncbi:ABC transporter ATP-binding protein [Arthrobacter psychrolactophilus]